MNQIKRTGKIIEAIDEYYEKNNEYPEEENKRIDVYNSLFFNKYNENIIKFRNRYFIFYYNNSFSNNYFIEIIPNNNFIGIAYSSKTRKWIEITIP
jgi:hypothetical protein